MKKLLGFIAILSIFYGNSFCQDISDDELSDDIVIKDTVVDSNINESVIDDDFIQDLPVEDNINSETEDLNLSDDAENNNLLVEPEVNDVFTNENSEKLTESETDYNFSPSFEVSDDSSEADNSDKKEEKKSRAGISDVPKSKRPKKIDSEKAKAAAEKDENDEVPEKNRNTIKFGIPSEIANLVDELNKAEDPRFTEEIYDLFQVTQSTVIQQKVIEYFTKLKDPCLEDFAVNLLNDPYDSRNDVVKACFSYIREVKTKEAIPAVLTLLESENETYFNDALSTIGEIGEAEEAVFLADYLDREDLSDAQRQSLMKTLGKLHAFETYDKIVEILENEDENSFVRMYAAESLGFMEKKEAVPVLVKAFTYTDPNLRQYALKGLSHFPNVVEAQATVIQGIRDEHWKVRQEAIKICEEQKFKDSIPYLTYRAENDSEKVIKEAAVKALGKMDSKEAEKFLIGQLDKKISDSLLTKIVSVLLDADNGEKEILEHAEKWLDEPKYKNRCKTVGKELSKHAKNSYTDVCLKYLKSKDGDIVGIGIDMYKNCKMSGVEAQLKLIADDRTATPANRKRAKKYLGIEDE